MLSTKARAGLLGMLAIFLVGVFASAPAGAQGPYWYHRAVGGQGKGTKLGNQQTGPVFLEVAGSGGEQKLKGKAGETVEIVAKQLQVKGIIYNNARQGQSKVLLTYIEPKLISPNHPNCVVTVGAANTVTLFAGIEWSWDGTTKQLAEQPQQNQKPDAIFLPKELAAGATELPTTEEFTKITFKGAECGILNGIAAPVKGNTAAILEPSNVGEWSTTQKQKIVQTKARQHFWNGTKNIGVETGLTLNGEPAELTGEASLKVLPIQGKQEQQELTLWEF